MPNYCQHPARLEDLIMIFHEDCGGIIIGWLGISSDLKCAECGANVELRVVNVQQNP